jgi:hypothetical protein
MLISPWAWLRRKAAESIALGVADGLAAVAPEGEETTPDLASLRALAAGSATTPRALAPPPEEEPGKPRGRRQA